MNAMKRITLALEAAVLTAFLQITLIGASPNIPRLDWQPRSDWLNVKTGVTPRALGNGRADDTSALQAALDRGAVGRTIYIPPGTYRIAKTLAWHGPGEGSAIIGAGRDTRLVWDGPKGGRMFWSDGVAYSRYVGLTWDGQGRAAVGFDHAAKRRFETEIQHRDEAFLNFTKYGIRVGHDQKLASAEILYHNCLFQNCGTAIGLLNFNDYDNTIDHCEFRDCGTGVVVAKGNFYARNCHFENSREVDFRVNAEHGCSIRRCTSLGSKGFISEMNGITPLTIQDCHVANWAGPQGAVRLNSPTLLFDCSFTDGAPGEPPVELLGGVRELLCSDNHPDSVARLVGPAFTNRVFVIPDGRFSGAVTSAAERFLQQTQDVSGKVFDAVRDFGAKGNGKADDTTAIQSAIDAARAWGRGATAYLPTGRYVVSRTLVVTGSDYTLSGSGFRCGLLWRGKAHVPMIQVSAVTNVTLANLAVGHANFGPMKHGDDILVTSPGRSPVRLAFDGIYAYGMYQHAPDRHGIHFLRLPADSVVDAEYVQGNLRITDCSKATLLFRTSYEGTATVEGREQGGGGLTGFLTRLTTRSRPALRVLGDQSLVMSDFYVEQSEQVVTFAGGPGESAGAVTIQMPKVHAVTEQPILDTRDYAGRIYLGQSQFYVGPLQTSFQSSGARPLRLILAGDFWYRIHPAFALARATKLTLLGNNAKPDSGVTPAAVAGISSALDDLRRLGAADLVIPEGSP